MDQLGDAQSRIATSSSTEIDDLEITISLDDEAVGSDRAIHLDEKPLAPPAPTVSVVIPSLNEAANIGWVLDRLPSVVDEVVLVDGRSTDDTVAIAREHRPDIRVVLEREPGKGVALRRGFEEATGDYIVMLDADGSMDPSEIEDFVNALHSGAGLVKGSRFVEEGGSEDITAFRRLGNAAFVRMVNVMYREDVTDLCYGYIAFPRESLNALDLDADGFEIETQIVTNALRAGLEIREVPSFERNRISGRSNLNPIRDGFRVLGTLIRARGTGGRDLRTADEATSDRRGPARTERTRLISMALGSRTRVAVLMAIVLALTAVLTARADAAPGDQVLFTENFENGLDAWQVNRAASGVVEIQNVGHDDPKGVRLTVPAADGSIANIKYNLSDPKYALSAVGWFKVVAGGCDGVSHYSNGNVPFFRFFDTNGKRVVGLYRINGPNCGKTAKLYLQHSGDFFRANKNIRLGEWYKLELRAAVQTPGESLVQVYYNDSLVHETTIAHNGSRPFASVVVHNEHNNQVGDLIADNITIGTFSAGDVPDTSCAAAPTLPTTTDPGAVILADGFESFDFDSWTRVERDGDGLATVQKNIVKRELCAAKIHVTSNPSSKANLRKDLPAGTADLWADGWFRVATEGAAGSNVPFFRYFGAAGTRVVDVYRQNGSGALYLRVPSGGGFAYHSLGRSLAMNEWANFKVHGDLRGAGDTVQVWLNGDKLFDRDDLNLGTDTFSTLRVGSEHPTQMMDLFVDDVVLTGSS